MCRLHPVYDCADERVQRDLYERADETNDQQQQECGPDRPDEMPIESPESVRWALRQLLREGVDTRFEPAEHLSLSRTEAARGLTPHVEIGAACEISWSGRQSLTTVSSFPAPVAWNLVPK